MRYTSCKNSFGQVFSLETKKVYKVAFVNNSYNPPVIGPYSISGYVFFGRELPAGDKENCYNVMQLE
jgi:hypothetical protein